jgi:glucose-1-phosphate cytidylyltransferase
MKAVLLAGGLGTRLSEETQLRPKPMIEIGGRPVLWHIMKLYAHHGITDFVVCCGYKGFVIKEYFANYFLHTADVTFDLAANSMEVHRQKSENWRVTLVDTGDDTMTGGRLARVAHHIQDEEAFCFTYGDGLSNVDIGALLRFHREQGCLATVTATHAPGRFGVIDLANHRAQAFREKQPNDGGIINGGYFVLSPKVLELIDGDGCIWERRPLETLAQRGELAARLHEGFWYPMDTQRDKIYLDQLWASGQAPWKVWE